MPEEQAVLDLFGGCFESLSPKQQSIARFLAANPRFASVATTKDIAQSVGVNPATVVRFAQSVGFRGFSQLKHNLRVRYLGSPLPDRALDHSQEKDQSEDPIRNALSQELRNVQDVCRKVDYSSIRKFAAMIHSSRKVLILGSGTYAALGFVLSHHCRATGYCIEDEFRSGSHLALSLALLGPEDLVIATGFWRGTKEIVSAMVKARDNGVKTAVITDNAFSPLTKAAQAAIVVPTEGTTYYQSITAGMSVVYAIIAELWSHRSPQAEIALRKTREMCEEMGVWMTNRP